MLRFFHGQLSNDYSFSFEPSLFNLSAHLQLQSAVGWNSFYAVNEEIKKVKAAIHFYVDNQNSSSPLRAPFGGLELSDDLAESQISEFVAFVVSELKASRVNNTLIKQSPAIVDDERITNAFLNAGFKIQQSEADSFIKVSGEFGEHLQERKAKKLRSLKKQNWVFEIKNHSHLQETYEFILRCRSGKDYSLSMTFEQIQQLAKTFPERIFLFQVLEESRIIAASICIKVKNNWLYDFYHDHDSEYNADNPILLLMDGIYGFCKANAIHWIELGTSMKGSEVNEGLLEFKERLGAVTVQKTTFVKEFSS